MKKISIKTVDGNRYEYIMGGECLAEALIELTKDWLEIEDDGITRMFFRPNIVTITIKDAEDG